MIPDAITRANADLRRHYAAEIAVLKRRAMRRKSMRRWAGSALACGLVLALGFAAFGWRRTEAPPTAPYAMALADGSHIHLDAGAIIARPIAPWRHEVRLLRGDAIFDIVHDATRPFVVHTGTATLTDLGTRFLVRTTPEGVAIAVYEGKVEVSNTSRHAMVLSAGQAANATGTGIAHMPAPDEDLATAWRQGRLIFRGAALAQVAEQLSHYRAEPIEIDGTDLAALKVNGTFRLDDIDNALTTLEQALPIRVHHEEGRTVLLSRPVDRTAPARR